MNIDHIGIVVRDMQKSIEYWKQVFHYTQMTDMVVNTRQKVKVVFMHKEGSLTVKLIEPVDQSSTIFAFARKGGGLHHLCFKCDDLNSQLKELTDQGLRVLTPPAPGEAFGGEPIAFLMTSQGLNIELTATDKRASRRED
jgi:methylmalonyl-CoA/ethylmalonyl-CoA epimerase